MIEDTQYQTVPARQGECVGLIISLLILFIHFTVSRDLGEFAMCLRNVSRICVDANDRWLAMIRPT